MRESSREKCGAEAASSLEEAAARAPVTAAVGAPADPTERVIRSVHGHSTAGDGGSGSAGSLLGGWLSEEEQKCAGAGAWLSQLVVGQFRAEIRRLEEGVIGLLGFRGCSSSGRGYRVIGFSGLFKLTQSGVHSVRAGPRGVGAVRAVDAGRVEGGVERFAALRRVAGWVGVGWVRAGGEAGKCGWGCG